MISALHISEHKLPSGSPIQMQFQKKSQITFLCEFCILSFQCIYHLKQDYNILYEKSYFLNMTKKIKKQGSFILGKNKTKQQTNKKPPLVLYKSFPQQFANKNLMLPGDFVNHYITSIYATTSLQDQIHGLYLKKPQCTIK